MMETPIATTRTGPPPSSRVDVSVAGALCGAWAVFFALGRTIGSGYHLLDDHEILRMVADLRGRSLVAALPGWLVGDLALRFRPFYVVHRMAEAAVFGDDLRLWALYTAALAAATSILLYLALRSVRFPVPAALAFTFFGLSGEQAAIWWRLGPNETIGMLCLAIALLGLTRWALTGSRSWRAAFWAGSVLASLSKESFVALLPVLVLAAAWAVAWSRGKTWRDALAACAPEAGLFGVVFTVEALVIVFVVGTEKIGYAGVRGVTPAHIWAAATQLVGRREAFTLLALAGLAALSRFLNGAGAWTAGWRRLASAAPPFVLAALVVGTQALLYAKSGLYERYRAPGDLAFAFLVAVLVRAALMLGDQETSREAPRPVSRGLRRSVGGTVVLAVAVLIVLPLAKGRLVEMERGAASFAADGRETQQFLDTIARLPPGTELLVAGGLEGVAEQFWSIRWYLSVRLAREQALFFFVEPADTLTPFAKMLVDSFEQNAVYPKLRPEERTVPPGAVALLRGQEEQFLRRAPWFDPAIYTRHALPGTFVVYTVHR